MSFDLLHPALQHHIINSLGWTELRPFQDAVIPRILDGENLIVLAPTAGGKTEASCFPTISKMLSENWEGLSVLYICPIKALLNNLDVRLQKYFSLVGRRAALWHGDVKRGARKSILREPPDLLLTTPESLEVMLISPNVDENSMFGNLRMVIVDEIHAFAGDDRGWHLLSVLERITKVAERDIQRVGLSATVGNPKEMVDWVAGSNPNKRGVYLPPDDGGHDDADVQLDYVGSIENASLVISRLHRGEKRLVFVDSRARAEKIGAELRMREVTTFVTHSSLSHDQRKQAEEAFSTGNDCVIVATSVLELGVDVGDLDRVIQIDSPATVSSFLQRMGRTGRRSGSKRNCLFLATKTSTLIQAAALIDLWKSGFVEPVEAPALPYHILSQQLMALCLQEKGIGRNEWFDRIRGVLGYSSMPAERVSQLLEWMLEKQIMWDDEGVLWLGQKGEEEYGRRNFLELFTVFMTPPLFSVRHGRREIGYVDDMAFVDKREGRRVLLLGGRAWAVTNLDWQRKIAYVEPTDAKGKTRWQGEGLGLGFHMCQSIKKILGTDDDRQNWSQRVTQEITEAREDFPWLRSLDDTHIVDTGEFRWWTFGGFGANASISRALSQIMRSSVRFDSFSMRFESYVKANEIENGIKQLSKIPDKQLRPNIDDRAITGLKFNECLPHDMAIEMLAERLHDEVGCKHIMKSPFRTIVASAE